MQPHNELYLILTYDADGAACYADLDGDPAPRTMKEVANALTICANMGVEKVKVLRWSDQADVTDKAIEAMAWEYPSDMPQPDFLTDCYSAQQIMDGVQ